MVEEEEHFVCEQSCAICLKRGGCPDEYEFSHSKWADELKQETKKASNEEEYFRNKYRVN